MTLVDSQPKPMYIVFELTSNILINGFRTPHMHYIVVIWSFNLRACIIAESNNIREDEAELVGSISVLQWMNPVCMRTGMLRECVCQWVWTRDSGSRKMKSVMVEQRRPRRAGRRSRSSVRQFNSSEMEIRGAARISQQWNANENLSNRVGRTIQPDCARRDQIWQSIVDCRIRVESKSKQTIKIGKEHCTPGECQVKWSEVKMYCTYGV